MKTRFLDLFLSALAVLGMAGMVYWLAEDVRKTVNRPVEPPTAVRIAQTDLQALPGGVPGADPKQAAAQSGWFPAPQQPVFSWEQNEEGWKLESDEPTALAPSAPEALGPDGGPEKPAPAKPSPQHLRLTNERATDGSHCLAIPASFPDPVTIFCRAALLRGVRFLAYDVYVPGEVGGYVGCLFFLKDKDGRWFQARSRTPLRPGAWTTVTADIRGGSPDVEPLGHLGQWDENQASQVQMIGLTFYGDRTYTGEICLDNFRGWLRGERFRKVLEEPDRLPGVSEERRRELKELLPLAAAVTPEPPALLNLRTDPVGSGGDLPAVGVFRPFTVRFELNRPVLNPFNPEEVDVRAVVETPSGKRFEVGGYWYQDFEMRDRYASEELVPVGRPEWRVRVTPREPGEHRVLVQVGLDGGRTRATGPVLRLQAVPSGERGFVRVSARDPNFFEFENGAFCYLVGHNVHTPVDMRCWSRIFEKEPPLPRGLKMYEDFFPKFRNAGQTVAEVWMASWWVGIEWTRHWPNYHGKGRYSLERAWKLDRLLDLARTNGLLVHLVLDNHGKISDWCDEEWDKNPYNIAADGPGWGWMRNASEYFTDPLARKLHQQRLRYIAARWAGDPAILGWEVVSEFDLTGSRGSEHLWRSAEGRDWFREMATYLRTADPYGRPLTNHYAGDYNRVDRELADTPALDYIVGDGYHEGPGFVPLAFASAAHFNTFQKKPYWITEYGGNWSATSEGRLKADLHGGLWATWMTDFCGTPLFWWYDFVDRRELYSHYRAFANYIQGEDRRGLNGKTERLALAGSSEGLSCYAYRWPNGAYGWVYNTEALQELPEPKERSRHEGVQVSLRGLSAGKYQVEFWDTWAGKVLGVEDQEADASGTLALRVPAFLCDVAFKVKRADASKYGPAGTPPVPPSGVPAVAPPKLPPGR